MPDPLSEGLSAFDYAINRVRGSCSPLPRGRATILLPPLSGRPAPPSREGGAGPTGPSGAPRGEEECRAQSDFTVDDGVTLIDLDASHLERTPDSRPVTPRTFRVVEPYTKHRYTHHCAEHVDAPLPLLHP
jgi:hypothetical protein